jgi:hypothetical protein
LTAPFQTLSEFSIKTPLASYAKYVHLSEEEFGGEIFFFPKANTFHQHEKKMLCA